MAGWAKHTVTCLLGMVVSVLGSLASSLLEPLDVITQYRGALRGCRTSGMRQNRAWVAPAEAEQKVTTLSIFVTQLT